MTTKKATKKSAKKSTRKVAKTGVATVAPSRLLMLLTILRPIRAVMANWNARRGVVANLCDVPVTAVLASVTLQILAAIISVIGITMLDSNPATGIVLSLTWLMFYGGGRLLYWLITYCAAAVWASDDGIKYAGDSSFEYAAAVRERFTSKLGTSTKKKKSPSPSRA